MTETITYIFERKNGEEVYVHTSERELRQEELFVMMTELEEKHGEEVFWHSPQILFDIDEYLGY